MQTTLSHSSAADLRRRLETLEAERAAATLAGLADDEAYMHDLAAEVHLVRAAFVGAAVTDIATLRGALGDRLQG